MVLDCSGDERELEDVLCIYEDHLFDTPAELRRWLGDDSTCVATRRAGVVC